MIEIILPTNKVIEVTDNLAFEFNSNLFSDELITANFSLPFEIPSTPDNLAALNHPFNIHAIPNVQNIDSIIRIAQVIEWKGILKVIEASRFSIKCTFQIAASAIADKLKQKLNSVNGVQINYDFGLRSSMWRYINPTPDGANPFTIPIIYNNDRFGFELKYGVGESSSNTYYLTIKQTYGDAGYKMFADLCRRINYKVDIPFLEDPTTYNHQNGKFYKTYEVAGDTNYFWYKATVNGPINLSGSGYTFLGYSETDVSNSAFKTVMDGSQYYLDPSLVPVCDLVAIPFFQNGVVWIIFFERPINGRKINIAGSFNNYTGSSPVHDNNSGLILFEEDSVVGGGLPNPLYRRDAGSKAYFEAANDKLVQILPQGLIPELDNPDLAYFPVYNPAGINPENFTDLDFPAYRGYVNYNGTQEIVYSSGFPRVLNLLKKQFEVFGIQLIKNIFNPDDLDDTTIFYSDFSKLVVYNPVLDEMPLAENNFGSYQASRSLALTSKLPDVTVEDFLNVLRKFYFLYVDFDTSLRTAKIWPLRSLFTRDAKDSAWNWDDKVTRIINIKQPLNQGFKISFAFDDSDELTKELIPEIPQEFLLNPVEAVINLAPEARVGSYCLVTSLNRFYVQSVLEDNTVQWVAGPLNLKPIEIDDAKDEYSLLASSTFMYQGIDAVYSADFPSAPTPKTWRVPYVKQPLYSDFFKQKTDFKLRFLFKGGSVEDNLGQEYIFGSSDGLQPDNTASTNFKMDYSQSGIVNLLGKDFLKLLDKGKIVTVEALFLIGDLTQIKMDRLITFHGRYFLIRKFQLQLPIKSAATVELMMLPL